MAEGPWYIASMRDGVPTLYHYVDATGGLQQSGSWPGFVSGYGTKRQAEMAIHWCIGRYGKYARSLEAVHSDDVRMHEIAKEIRRIR